MTPYGTRYCTAALVDACSVMTSYRAFFSEKKKVSIEGLEPSTFGTGIRRATI